MLPCLLGCLLLSVPRVLIVCLWLFSDYLERAYESTLWPVLGFLFLPYTMLAYALAWHMGPDGEFGTLGKAVIVIAVLVDLGVIGGNAQRKRGDQGA